MWKEDDVPGEVILQTISVEGTLRDTSQWYKKTRGKLLEADPRI